MIPEEKLNEDTPEIKRCQCHINKCKEAAWKRWEQSNCDSFKKDTE